MNVMIIIINDNDGHHFFLNLLLIVVEYWRIKPRLLLEMNNNDRLSFTNTHTRAYRTSKKNHNDDDNGNQPSPILYQHLYKSSKFIIMCNVVVTQSCRHKVVVKHNSHYITNKSLHHLQFSSSFDMYTLHFFLLRQFNDIIDNNNSSIEITYDICHIYSMDVYVWYICHI